MDKLSERYPMIRGFSVTGEEIISENVTAEVAQLEAENEALRNEISSDNDELLDCVIDEAKLEDRIIQLEAENEGLKTYAMLLEGNTFHSECIEIRQALGLNQVMAEWVIPDEHRKALEAGGK